MSSETVGLYWKRPPEWERFVRTAGEIFPARDSAAGILVELAWNDYRSNDRAIEIVERFLSATEGLSEGGEGKKITRDRFGGSDRTTVRVSKSVKEEMAAFASRSDVPNYMILRTVVTHYLDGGVLGWVTKQLEKLESRIDFSDLRKSAPERRRDDIIRALERITGDDELTSFTLAEFDQAIDEGPKTPKTADNHARETYLPLVLDKLGMTWHPDDDELFEKTDAVDETADIRQKPKALMDERDTELALAIDAAEAADNSNRPIKYTKGDAVVLGGISYSNADKYMRRVANWSGYTFDKREGVLKVATNKITDRQVLDVLDDSSCEWVEPAADLIEDTKIDSPPKPVIVNKIARAKNPEIDVFTDEHDYLLKRVTDDDVALVREHLDSEETEDDEQHGVKAADERLDQVTDPRAFADGGEDRGESE